MASTAATETYHHWAHRNVRACRSKKSAWHQLYFRSTPIGKQVTTSNRIISTRKTQGSTQWFSWQYNAVNDLQASKLNLSSTEIVGLK